jgi:hypothetical protein
MAPPSKAPVPVLSGSPFGDTQPVNPTVAANAKVKTCRFIIQNPFNQTSNGVATFKNQPAAAASVS